jgi:hypothetical protein
MVQDQLLKVSAVKIHLLCCGSDQFLKQEKKCHFYNHIVGTKTMSLRKLSLPSRMLCLGQPSTSVHNSRSLILPMGCLHVCLIPTALFEVGRVGVSCQMWARTCPVRLHILLIMGQGLAHTLAWQRHKYCTPGNKKALKIELLHLWRWVYAPGR